MEMAHSVEGRLPFLDHFVVEAKKPFHVEPLFTRDPAAITAAAVQQAVGFVASGADIVDNYVETLCEGDDHKYLYKGECRQMHFFNAGTIDGQQVSFWRTVHGPVTGYATVDDERVAISRKRSSYLLDGVDLRDVATFAPSTICRERVGPIP